MPEARDSPVLFRSPVWRIAGSDLHGVNQQCDQVESSRIALMLLRLVVLVGGSCSGVTSLLPHGPRLPEGEASMLLFNMRSLLPPLPATTISYRVSDTTLFSATATQLTPILWDANVFGKMHIHPVACLTAYQLIAHQREKCGYCLTRAFILGLQAQERDLRHHRTLESNQSWSCSG